MGYLVANITAEHNATFELLDSCDISRPYFQFVLWDHVTSSWVIKILVHLHHLECVHDPPEECVVELDALGVRQLLDMLQCHSQCHL